MFDRTSNSSIESEKNPHFSQKYERACPKFRLSDRPFPIILFIVPDEPAAEEYTCQTRSHFRHHSE
jgi:hypothetical protein